MSKESKVAFFPAGEMNTALALKADRNGHQATIWFHSEDSFQFFQRTQESPRLEGIKLTNIKGTTDKAEALADAEMVFLTPRSWDLRSLLREIKPFIREDAIIVTVTKGFDDLDGNYYTPSQVIRQEIPASENRIAVLSGPNFARQIAEGKITGTTVVSYQDGEKAAKRVSKVLHNGLFWVDLYKGNPVDVEVIGAFKNVVGLVMGFARTIPEYSENTAAFILQKGLDEASRLCEAMGGNPKAIMQLCGVGDYGLLMNSTTSRNVQAGETFGRGETDLTELMDPNSKKTVEGVRTVKAIRALSKEYRVFMPLSRIVYKVLYEGMNPSYAVRRLLLRNF